MAEVKQRHGCLTAWLILMLVGNSLAALLYASGAIKRGLPNAPAWTFPAFIVICIANIVFSIALFQWRKWGFFGFLGTTILSSVVSLRMGVPIFHVAAGTAVSFLILFGVLGMGGDKNAWAQLE